MSKIYHNEDFLKLNTVKQKIISSLLAYNYELIAMCYARIYTASSQSTNWLYTELEGGLTIVIDYARKSARFLLFDLNTLEINFECELYKKFNLFYTSLTKTLHCFEVNQGFIGFLIPDVNSSQDFFKSVYKLTDTVIANIIKKRIIPDKNEIKLNSSKVLALLKEKLSSEYFFKDNVLTEKKLELDLNDIEKTMNMIEYDTENEKFLITGNVKEIDEIVGRVKSVKYSDKNGLKIKDTVAYAMEIYQSMMNSMVKNKEISARKEKELAEEKKKNSLFQSIKKQVDGGSDNNNKVHQQQQITKKPEAPKGVPAVPKGVPPVPKGVPAVPKGVPPVPKGVPPVPKGIPAIPKTVPSVPATQSAQNSIPNQNASNTNSIDNNNMDDIQNNNHTNEIGDNSTNTTSVPVEKKKPYVRKEPKMDMMTELKMKLANRGNVNANPLNNTINKPPVIMNTSTITVTTTNTETNDSNTNSIILLENSINSETGKLINTSSNNTITSNYP